MIEEMIKLRGDGLLHQTNASAKFLPLKGELQAKLVAPRKIILFWDVSELPKRIINLFFDQKFEGFVQVVRIYDVTNILFNGKNAHYYHELPVSYNSGHWFIKGLVENRSYIAEIGIYISGKDYFPLYRSGCIHTPTPEMPNGNVPQQDFLHFKKYEEEETPKWMEQVSTYSYYLESNKLEENND
ncbi:DUF4912 domain-containing protein [Neobacillus sp. 19]|uniref:DUF4912 domain-containing protein n=1 Tax=Neobacillus sp. 19 TaxID=3394458 RepID=UPI003BF6C46E